MCEMKARIHWEKACLARMKPRAPSLEPHELGTGRQEEQKARASWATKQRSLTRALISPPEGSCLAAEGMHLFCWLGSLCGVTA